MGRAVYPHPQWQQLEQLWDSYYPTQALEPPLRRLLAQLVESMPALASVLAGHRPAALRGRSLPEVLQVGARQPHRLQLLYRRWTADPRLMYRAAPTLAFSVLGQARFSGWLDPEAEAALLGRLLTYWALRASLDTAASCGASRNQAIANLEGV
jgi:hypothetical protein